MNFITSTDYSACKWVDSAASEYTHIHRQAWLLLLRTATPQVLPVHNLKSWMRLWGRLGAELFNCFWSGDQFIRKDMINLARQAGSWQGETVARSLEGCLSTPASHPLAYPTERVACQRGDAC